MALTPIALDFTDELRRYYGNAPDGAGTGVTVGVVDTGVGPHPDLWGQQGMITRDPDGNMVEFDDHLGVA